MAAVDPEVQLRSALNLMRRMPPALTEVHLTGLCNLIPDLTDDLLQRIDQPLKVTKDGKTGQHFVLCDYNRDGDSYRYIALLVACWAPVDGPHDGPSGVHPPCPLSLIACVVLV